MDVSVLDRLPEAVVVLDHDGCVLHANDRAGSVLGVGPAAIGEDLAKILELRDDTGKRCELPPPRPRVGTRLAERVLQVITDDGSSRPVALSGRWGDGAWVLTARPAGRREALDRVHGDVVATVSHEIRSPLSSVKGFTRTLLSRWDRFSDDQKRAMLETVDADADRVTRLLMDLLEVSRIDAGRVRLRRSWIDLTDLVAGVVDKARHRDDGAHRSILVTVEPDLPRVPGDSDRLEQVMTNLLDNALRYAPEGDIRVSLGRDGDGVRLTVSDDGPGVASDVRGVIFRKFGRGRHDHRAGTGLGLYISRGLVEAHGGSIWLDNTTVQGATFYVWLPASDASVPTTANGHSGREHAASTLRARRS